jgi:uncharacterized membrane protein YgdD (TMEM256/DUF423 family)
MNKYMSATAASLGMLAILLGAFGAHALKEKLDPALLQSFETGVRYMMYHVLAILFIQNNRHLGRADIQRISLLFLSGILCFSGSIFLISMGVVKASAIWFITPFGGFLFLAGWFLTAIGFLKGHRTGQNP